MRRIDRGREKEAWLEETQAKWGEDDQERRRPAPPATFKRLVGEPMEEEAGEEAVRNCAEGCWRPYAKESQPSAVQQSELPAAQPEQAAVEEPATKGAEAEPTQRKSRDLRFAYGPPPKAESGPAEPAVNPTAEENKQWKSWAEVPQGEE